MGWRALTTEQRERLLAFIRSEADQADARGVSGAALREVAAALEHEQSLPISRYELAYLALLYVVQSYVFARNSRDEPECFDNLLTLFSTCLDEAPPEALMAALGRKKEG